MKLDIIRQPDRVRAELESEIVSLQPESGLWQAKGTALRVAQEQDALLLTLLASAQPVRRIFLRWSRSVAPGRVLGDHWERGYGDLEWRGLVPERVLPWFFLHHDGEETCGAGVPTMADIVKELMKPGRDPRDELPAPILRTDVMEAKDLKPGMELQGTVRNVIDFGVFVDIGVHQDGLVHISKLPRRVKHPSELLSVGDVVTVWVVEVDEKKKRISLTMKKPG